MFKLKEAYMKEKRLKLGSVKVALVLVCLVLLFLFAMKIFFEVNWVKDGIDYYYRYGQDGDRDLSDGFNFLNLSMLLLLYTILVGACGLQIAFLVKFLSNSESLFASDKSLPSDNNVNARNGLAFMRGLGIASSISSVFVPITAGFFTVIMLALYGILSALGGNNKSIFENAPELAAILICCGVAIIFSIISGIIIIVKTASVSRFYKIMKMESEGYCD